MPKNNNSGLSKTQERTIQEFLQLFSDVEQALKARLGRRKNDVTGMRKLVEEYAAKNIHWSQSADRLHRLADIRNLLTHQGGRSNGYPIALAPASLHSLKEVHAHLNHPEPVSLHFKKSVVSVSKTDTLAHVVQKAFQMSFSQFPVVTDNEFGGLITETEITRWLGHRAKLGGPIIDLEQVTVATVQREKDPDFVNIPIFQFERLEAPIDKVMSRFAVKPALEVVLLTASGRRDTRIEGIITQWDAARYPW